MISDAVRAKMDQIRGKYEVLGYEVIQNPPPEAFPFETGRTFRYLPLVLARRGSENIVFEVWPAHRLPGESLMDRAAEIRKHPGWRLYLVTCDDVVPFDAPGAQGEPPDWTRLEQRADEALRVAREAAPAVALLALWAVLEGVLRRSAADHDLPMERLPAVLLIPSLYDNGPMPFGAYEPLMAAEQVHRRVVHGYEVPEAELRAAVHAVADALPAIIAENLQHAS
jgi:hypothetical protein